jgi:hypothetical protein
MLFPAEMKKMPSRRRFWLQGLLFTVRQRGMMARLCVFYSITELTRFDPTADAAGMGYQLHCGWLAPSTTAKLSKPFFFILVRQKTLLV